MQNEKYQGCSIPLVPAKILNNKQERNIEKRKF
jgi:hypothetical protein